MVKYWIRGTKLKPEFVIPFSQECIRIRWIYLVGLSAKSSVSEYSLSMTIAKIACSCDIELNHLIFRTKRCDVSEENID